MIEEKSSTTSTSASAAPETVTSKPKRRYSKRWKSIQQVEKGTTKAARRLVNAVHSGVNVWIVERGKSADSRRDGAVRDVRKNLRKALRKTSRTASEAPADVFDALTQLRVPKILGLGRQLF